MPANFCCRLPCAKKQRSKTGEKKMTCGAVKTTTGEKERVEEEP